MPTGRHLPVRCCCWLRGSFPVCGILILTALALTAALPAQAKEPNDIVRFRLRDKYLILVQTTVDGAGPFPFLLDTGSTHTVIDPGLAQQLRTPVIGETSLVTVSDIHKDRLVRLDKVRVGNSEVSELGAIIDKLDEVKLRAPGIRGVLGEDFLSQFDILIDYRGRALRFDGDVPAGERCRIETAGRYQDMPTKNRLLVKAQIMDVGRGEVQLQLDTGAKLPELFPIRHDTITSQPWAGSMAFTSGPNGTSIHSHTTIRVGSALVRDLDLVQSRRGVAFDALGLLPAAIFRSIYISHSGGYVILNPTE